jgi:hypothetical protein
LKAGYSANKQDGWARGSTSSSCFQEQDCASKGSCYLPIHEINGTQCASTHTAHKHFTKTEAAEKDFIAMMQVKIQGRNLDDILNMDQMPIPYLYHASAMLELKGARPSKHNH